MTRNVPPIVRWIVVASFAAAAVVFLVVQDRITAAGVRDYVNLQRGRDIGQPSPSIEEIMRPAVRRSVRLGSLWGGIVLAAGLTTAALVSRISSRRPPHRIVRDRDGTV